MKTPVKGSIVTVCRSNLGPGEATQIEWFEATGEPLPPLRAGYYYQIETPEQVKQKLREQYGV